MMSHVLSLHWSYQLFSMASYIANNYINNMYFICSLATWAKYRETPIVITCSSTLKFNHSAYFILGIHIVQNTSRDSTCVAFYKPTD